MFLADENITTEEVVKRWKNNNTVFSIELGGLGPGYEQALQIALFTILDHWLDKKIAPNTLTKNKRFTKKCEKDLEKLNLGKGLSGAQYGAARSTAYQFLKFGYSKMMKMCPKNRLIQVSKNFPKYKEPNVK